MAFEWEKVELFGANNDGDPVSYTVADGTAVSKGTLMKLTDPRTAIAATTDIIPTPIAGVASTDKEANDGATRLALWTNGIFEVSASGAIRIGESVTGTLNNYVISSGALTEAASGAILGRALESGTDAEVINVRLQL